VLIVKITVVMRCKACTVLDLSNTGIMGLNPAAALGVYIFVCCIFPCGFRVYDWLNPTRGVLPNV